jgi:glycosyltransferase involved in cell wall biosynthesis
VIIAARNEEALLRRSLNSILTTTYKNVELIVVNDRSSDATGQIIDQLAAKDSRVRAVHITSLPEGWLGKVHALHRGTQCSSGEWLLFTDADIHFEPQIITKAIAYAEHEKLDQLSLLPDDRTQHEVSSSRSLCSPLAGSFCSGCGFAA